MKRNRRLRAALAAAGALAAEGESLIFGTGFGTVTEIVTAPNGNLFVVSLSDGSVYEIFRTK
jgi:hypothetical protein